MEVYREDTKSACNQIAWARIPFVLQLAYIILGTYSLVPQSVESVIHLYLPNSVVVRSKTLKIWEIISQHNVQP
jgi:hypothetical protein